MRTNFRTWGENAPLKKGKEWDGATWSFPYPNDPVYDGNVFGQGTFYPIGMTTPELFRFLHGPLVGKVTYGASGACESSFVDYSIVGRGSMPVLFNGHMTSAAFTNPDINECVPEEKEFVLNLWADWVKAINELYALDIPSGINYDGRFPEPVGLTADLMSNYQNLTFKANFKTDPPDEEENDALLSVIVKFGEDILYDEIEKKYYPRLHIYISPDDDRFTFESVKRNIFSGPTPIGQVVGTIRVFDLWDVQMHVIREQYDDDIYERNWADFSGELSVTKWREYIKPGGGAIYNAITGAKISPTFGA